MTEEQQANAFRSSIGSRMKAKLSNNSMTQFFAWTRQKARGPNVFTLTFVKSHYHSLFLTSAILALGFYSGVKVTLTRKDTFGRSYPQIEQKFGKEHKEAFGEDAKISQLGWPDMGDNLYSSALPYGDWCKMNNVQRQHEIGYEYLTILLPNAFISALTFPRYTTFCLASFLITRFNHFNGYTNIRGHNKAYAHEEFMKLVLFMTLMGSLYSSMRLTGVPQKISGAFKATSVWQYSTQTRLGLRITKLRGR